MTKKDKPNMTGADKVSGDPVLNKVIDDFNSARTYIRNNYQKTWEDCFKEYNNKRTRRGYSGVADDFIPETHGIVESLKGAIAGSKQKFIYMPMTEEQESDTEMLNNLVDFYWSLNNMTEKVLSWVGDMIIYGNGVMMVTWDSNMPTFHNIPLFDFFVDPTATHINRPEEQGYAKFAGYRYLTSKEELQAKKMFDVKSGDMINMYSNLDDIESGTSDDDVDDKSRKEQLLGSTLGKDAGEKQIEIIEYYTAKKKIVIANRSVVIYNDKTPFQKDAYTEKVTKNIDGKDITFTVKHDEIKGFLPFAILRNYIDSNLFYARGDVEILIPLQEALNDTSSQKRDNLSYALNNMWQIDPKYKNLADQIESAPGNVLPIPKGALTPLEKDDVSASADNEISRLTQAMRSATAANAAVQGNQQEYSRTSATEVASQLNQAASRYTTKIQNLEDDGFAQLARIIYKCIQIFVNKTIAVRILGKNGVTWKDYDPSKFIGEYQPRVILESSSKAEAAQVAQAIQVASQYCVGNPLVNQEEFLRKALTSIFPESSKEDIDKLLTPPVAPVMGGDGQAVDPALTQNPNTQVMPGGKEALLNGGGTPTGATARGKATQSGIQGGGGAGTAVGNNPRQRAVQPSTMLTNKVIGK